MKIALASLNRYWRRARLYPALLALAPVIALTLTLVPWSKLALPHLAASFGLAVLIYAFSEFARRQGKKYEHKPVRDLGPNHTSTILWHSDTRIHPSLKDLVVNYVAKKLGIARLTAEDEQKDPAHAEAFYDRIAGYMRDHTRGDGYEILFQENVAYGFWRNLLGMKTIGLVANFIVIIIAAAIAGLSHRTNADIDIHALAFILIVSAGHALFFLLIVKRDAVVEASNTYLRQLFLSFDTHMSGQLEKPAPRKKAS